MSLVKFFLTVFAIIFLVACAQKYGNLKNENEAIEAAKKYLYSKVNLGSRNIAEYKFSAEFHESWTIPSNHCEDLQGYTEEQWKKCNPPMYSVIVTHKNAIENVWDHEPWYDDEETKDGCFSGFFILFKSETGELVNSNKYVVFYESGHIQCD